VTRFSLGSISLKTRLFAAQRDTLKQEIQWRNSGKSWTKRTF